MLIPRCTLSSFIVFFVIFTYKWWPFYHNEPLWVNFAPCATYYSTTRSHTVLSHPGNSRNYVVFMLKISNRNNYYFTSIKRMGINMRSAPLFDDKVDARCTLSSYDRKSVFIREYFNRKYHKITTLSRLAKITFNWMFNFIA